MMTEFLITFGFFGLITIPLIIMFLVCGVDLKHKFGGAIVVLMFWLMISFGFALDSKGKQEAWNGGYCECGAHWELRGANKSRTGNETKYYQCPKCYAEIKQ